MRRWYVLSLPWSEHAVIDEYLRAGWEPFAATHGNLGDLLWLRKKAG